MLAVAIEARPVAGRQVLPVHPQVRIALARRPTGKVRVVPLARDHEGREQLDRPAPELPHHARRDGVSGPGLDGPAAVGAVRDPELGEQQAQEVMDLGGGGDGAPRPAAARPLLDRHRRRDAEHRVHVRAGRRLHELPGVGVERFEIAALSLREHHVEREGALAAPAHPGDGREPAARQAHVDVLEVVVAGAPDFDGLVRAVAGGRRADRKGSEPPFPGPGACAARRRGSGIGPERRRAGRGVLRRSGCGVSAPVPLPEVGAKLAAGVAARVGRDRRGGAFAHDPAPGVAALGAEIDDPVGGGDHVEMVLDDHDGVPRRDQRPERGEQDRHVPEVKAGGRLVEEEEGAAVTSGGRGFRVPAARAGGPSASLSRVAVRPRVQVSACAPGSDPAPVRSGEVARELQALRLPAAQGGDRLAEGDVAEPDGAERGKRLAHLRRVREPHDGLVHGQVEHVRDGEAVRGELHLQHVRAVAPPVAVRAAQVHVAQKLHFEVLEAVARAGGAASVRVVEAEAAGGVPALAGEGFGGEQPADRVERADVARRHGAAGLADRRLVHHHHVPDRIRSLDAVVAARGLARAAEPLQEPAVTDVFEQGGLAGAADPGDADQAPERDPHVDALQVVLRRAPDEEMAGGRGWRGSAVRAYPCLRAVFRAAGRRRGHLQPAGQIGAGERPGAPRESARRALVHHFAARRPRPRPEVEHPVGGADHLRIVLHHQDRVARVAQPVEDFDHAPEVARVQPHARLVEDEQGVDERRPERGGEVDALDFAAAQGAGLAVEGEIAEAHVDEVAKA